MVVAKWLSLVLEAAIAPTPPADGCAAMGRAPHLDGEAGKLWARLVREAAGVVDGRQQRQPVSLADLFRGWWGQRVRALGDRASEDGEGSRVSCGLA